MAPEYEVVIEEKTGRYIIEANRLPEEIGKDIIDKLWVVNPINSYLKRGLEGNAIKRFSEDLPRSAAHELVQAAVKGSLGFKVKFNIDSGEYQIIEP